MKVDKTPLDGVLIIKPSLHLDARGFFKETFQKIEYQKIGIEEDFVQDNFSRSRSSVLRGLHFQVGNAQGKLVSCSRGAVFDVVADIAPKSENFGKYFAIELSEANHKQLWIPPGYAHGFCVLSEVAEVQYKCTDFYDSNLERGVNWNDPTLAIPWPIKTPIISEKDAAWPRLSDIAN